MVQSSKEVARHSKDSAKSSKGLRKYSNGLAIVQELQIKNQKFLSVLNSENMKI